MREIEFRGKRVDNGEWIYGSYQADVMALNKHTVIYSDSEGYYCEDEVIPETVGQYTGLKDKNGTEIYDGDIIKVFLYDGATEKHTITWKVESYRYTLSGLWSFDNTLRCEVIGNIHDNPELLVEVQDE